MDHSKSKIVSGNLTLGTAAVSSPAKTKTKVTCAKGKKTKQFVGKCPKGYVKK